MRLESDSKPDRSRRAPRLLAATVLAGAALAAATPVASASSRPEHCPSPSAGAGEVVVSAVGCHAADAVIDLRLAGRRRLDGFSCRPGRGRSVECRRGRSEIRFTLEAPAPGPAPPPAPGPTPVRPVEPARVADSLSIDSAGFGPAGLNVIATATADDGHDSVIMWLTAGSCATEVPAAESEANFGGAGGLIESEVAFGAESRFETLAARYEVTQTAPFTSTLNVTKHQVSPGEYSTVCALLFDPVGESVYPGNPVGIPQDHVFLATQAPLGS
jgi:hypothetical protein